MCLHSIILNKTWEYKQFCTKGT